MLGFNNMPLKQDEALWIIRTRSNIIDFFP